jgi:hypothetical protein
MEQENDHEPNRSKAIIFRVTEDEKEAIYTNAKAAGKKYSQFLRELGLNTISQPRKPPEERQALAGIANNLNQVARCVNAGHAENEWLPMLQQMLKRLDEYFL